MNCPRGFVCVCIRRLFHCSLQSISYSCSSTTETLNERKLRCCGVRARAREISESRGGARGAEARTGGARGVRVLDRAGRRRAIACGKEGPEGACCLLYAVCSLRLPAFCLLLLSDVCCHFFSFERCSSLYEGSTSMLRVVCFAS